MGGLEAALGRGDPERRQGLDGLGEALHGVPAEVLQPEAVADEPPRRGGR